MPSEPGMWMAEQRPVTGRRPALACQVSHEPGLEQHERFCSSNGDRGRCRKLSWGHQLNNKGQNRTLNATIGAGRRGRGGPSCFPCSLDLRTDAILANRMRTTRAPTGIALVSVTNMVSCGKEGVWNESVEY